ncbi:MAG: hypothetical protein OYH77_01995 [Pseudomonadota bacterium]|nr:hypothetical protein [Pseudomonadota bacterium]
MRWILLCVIFGANQLSAEQVRVPERFTEHNLALTTTDAPAGYEETVQTVAIGSSRYIVGGIIGTTFGMGLGHMVQRRYFVSRAWFYSLIPAAILSAAVLGGMHTTPTHNSQQEWQKIMLLALTLKIPEIIHVWLPENAREAAAIKKVKFAPVLTINAAGFAINL